MRTDVATQNFGGPDPGVTDLVAGSGYARSLGFADGKLLVATVAYTDSGPPSIRLIRLLADGGLDPTFGSNGVVDTGLVTFGGLFATRMADGRIVLATTGPDQRNYAFPDMMVARLLPDGSLDPSFSEDGMVLVTYPGSEYTSEGPLVVLRNGDVVVAASATIKRGTADYRTRSVLIKFSSRGDSQAGIRQRRLRAGSGRTAHLGPRHPARWGPRRGRLGRDGFAWR